MTRETGRNWRLLDQQRFGGLQGGALVDALRHSPANLKDIILSSFLAVHWQALIGPKTAPPASRSLPMIRPLKLLAVSTVILLEHYSSSSLRQGAIGRVSVSSGIVLIPPRYDPFRPSGLSEND